jgi:hypothetical protein
MILLRRLRVGSRATRSRDGATRYSRVVAKGRSDRPLPDQIASVGSIPILSLTAIRSCCLQPRYRSVVSMDTCPRRNWGLIQFAVGKMTQTCAGAPEIMRCKLANPGSACRNFHDARRPFGVIPSPQILLALLIARNTRPVVMRADSVQEAPSSSPKEESELYEYGHPCQLRRAEVRSRSEARASLDCAYSQGIRTCRFFAHSSM